MFSSESVARPSRDQEIGRGTKSKPREISISGSPYEKYSGLHNSLKNHEASLQDFKIISHARTSSNDAIPITKEQ